MHRCLVWIQYSKLKNDQICHDQFTSIQDVGDQLYKSYFQYCSYFMFNTVILNKLVLIYFLHPSRYFINTACINTGM